MSNSHGPSLYISLLYNKNYFNQSYVSTVRPSCIATRKVFAYFLTFLQTNSSNLRKFIATKFHGLDQDLLTYEQFASISSEKKVCILGGRIIFEDANTERRLISILSDK